MLAIPRKQRAMVRKGIKEELRSEVDDGVDRLYDVYTESLRNLGTPVVLAAATCACSRRFSATRATS